MLWFWWGSGFGADVLEHTRSAMDVHNNLLSLLEIPISLVKSSAGNYERIDRKSWSKIVDLNELERRAKALVENPVSPAHPIADRFLHALARDQDFEGL